MRLAWLPDQARETSLEMLPHLLESRSAEVGGLELGPVIGRGSYGKVYKGARPAAPPCQLPAAYAL
jgi:hypothetical protein